MVSLDTILPVPSLRWLERIAEWLGLRLLTWALHRSIARG